MLYTLTWHDVLNILARLPFKHLHIYTGVTVPAAIVPHNRAAILCRTTFRTAVLCNYSLHLYSGEKRHENKTRCGKCSDRLLVVRVPSDIVIDMPPPYSQCQSDCPNRAREVMCFGKTARVYYVAGGSACKIQDSDLESKNAAVSRILKGRYRCPLANTGTAKPPDRRS